MVDLTVVIRAYNAANRLPKIFACLQQQRIPADLDWEILVVDNNSRDKTAQIVHQYARFGQFLCPLRYVLETRQGAAFARQRALLEAQADLVAFLDDDNYPVENWLAEVWDFGSRHPQVGAYSGKIHGDFEVSPPANFYHLASYLAVIDRGDSPFSYSLRRDRVLPPGAGLVLRKSAWMKSVPKTFSISGPVGNSLGLKGEDIELLGWLQKAGWDILYNPKMVIFHHIPAWRLEREYLLSLVRSIGLSQHRIRMQRLEPWQRPFLGVAYVVNDLLKVIMHYVRHYSVLKTDVVVACQFEKLKSTLVGPFRRKLQKRSSRPRSSGWPLL